LLQNQVETGNAIKPLYGDAAGEKLTTLLKSNILTAADLIAAAKAGDKSKQEDPRSGGTKMLMRSLHFSAAPTPGTRLQRK